MRRGMLGTAIWQRNYYKHVIRDEGDLERVRDYIGAHPLRWDKDEENPVNPHFKKTRFPIPLNFFHRLAIMGVRNYFLHLKK